MRVLLVEGTYWLENIIEILRKEFNYLGFKILNKKASNFKLKIYSLFN